MLEALKLLLMRHKCHHDWELHKQIVRESELGICIIYYFICKKCGKISKRKVYQ